MKQLIDDAVFPLKTAPPTLCLSFFLHLSFFLSLLFFFLSRTGSVSLYLTLFLSLSLSLASSLVMFISCKNMLPWDMSGVGIPGIFNWNVGLWLNNICRTVRWLHNMYTSWKILGIFLSQQLPSLCNQFHIWSTLYEEELSIKYECNSAGVVNTRCCQYRVDTRSTLDT